MRKNNLVAATIPLAILLSSAVSIQAQSTGIKKTFNVDPYKSTGFIENAGQFTGIPGIDGNALFGIDNTEETIIFTNKGLDFIYTVPVLSKGKTPIQTIMGKMDKEIKEKGDKGDKYRDENDDILLKQKFNIVSMHWKNSNPNVQVIAEGILPGIYYTKDPGNKDPYKSSLYKKITYKNLYPGIDVEYVFYEKGGMKYTFHVQPGADISKIAMQYDNSTPKLDDAGDIYLNTEKGIIIDHKPITFYGSSHTPVASFFSVNGNEVHFNVAAYPSTEKLTIDPWTMSPGFTNLNKAYDIVRNNTSGDIYAFGGYAPYEVKRLSSAGALLWTYVTNPIYGGPSSNYYGDLAIDPTGDLYVSAGCCSGNIEKINGIAATNMWTQGGYSEPWRLQYDVFGNRLIAAGYVGFGGDNICSINPSTGVSISSGTIIAPVNAAEIRAIIVEPTSSKVHCLHVSQYPTTTLATNRISGNTGAFTLIYNQQSNYMLGEIGSYYASCDNTLYCSNGNCFHGTNALAVTAAFIYSTDGATVIKRDITTGALLAQAPIPGGIAETNSGIQVDPVCGYVFCGSQNAVVKYDANLVQLATIPTTGPVHDLVLGVAQEIISCGVGFVRSDTYTTCGNLQATVTGTSLLCFNVCTGTATATVTTGTSPYTYVWTPGNSTTQSVSNLCAGTYTCLVTDATGLTVTGTYVVTSPTPLTTTSTSTAITCNNGTNGSATATATGGTPGYTYSWVPSGGSNANATGLGNGTYTCFITDANGCTTQQIVTLTNPPPIIATATHVNTTCGFSNGTATATASGGTGTLTYNWTPSGGTGVNATGLAAGNYTVTVTDANGCTQTAIVTVAASTGITPSLTTQTNLTCSTSLNGTATVGVVGGNSPYTYAWSPSGGTNATASGMASGTYTCTITDASGCTGTQVVTITAPPPVVATSTFTNATCGNQDGTATATASGGTGPYTYSWSPSGGTSANATGLNVGSYTCTITDASGCTQTTSVIIVFSNGPTATVGPDVTITGGGSTPLVATGGGTYSWSPTWGLSCGTCPNPTANPTVTTLYCCTVTDQGGCTDIACMTVYVDIPCPSNADFSAPNAFSPNGDGHNDFFTLEGWRTCLKKYYLRVYDRWGEKVFETRDILQGWDGTYKGQPLDPAVFVYYLDATLENGTEIVKKGNVSLIR